ncbi:short subunit dehydrogenase [Paenibacillus sp. BK033]|uniref:SDR family NAD(P)-dependent oxidoreductase n=1 Tax=Paenibacillus sp. BK033 TaxID=2512133 RepID=UPI0010D4073E|nr:short subunit dehydrogenase [Paenibacillus sp. BK033]
MTNISIVTGGSRGLGRNTAISIARHGGDVILTYRSQAEEANSVVAEIEALGVKRFLYNSMLEILPALLPLPRLSVRLCSQLGIALHSIIW